MATKADVVVVDPIYLMDYESNTSKVAGGDVANTSKKIRRIAGYTGATIHVITQAEEVRDDTDEDGNRELRAPKRAEIKKTKAILEDAANVFGIDSLGRSRIDRSWQRRETVGKVCRSKSYTCRTTESLTRWKPERQRRVSSRGFLDGVKYSLCETGKFADC